MAIFTSAGIAAALGTAAGFFTSAAAFVLNTAVGLGVSLIGQALAGKPNANAQNFAINGTLQGGGDLARSFIIGRYATAGSLVWVNTWGKDGDTPNAYLTQIIALSDLPVAGLDEFWVNGEKVELGSAHPSLGRNVLGTYADSLWISFHDGNQTTHDAGIGASASNTNRSWPPSRVGKGVAYVAVTARVSANKFSGVPSFKFVVRGRPLYDPSRDSSVGGVGPQRRADPSTWGGDGDNLPAVQIYNVLAGIYYDGQWFYGLQNLPAARLPVGNWIAQINKHRATIEGASGPEPMYRSGGEISVDAPIASAIEGMLTACQGKIAEVGGVYTLHSGAPDGPVISFSDGDILSTEEQEFTPFLGLADTINGVSATYPSPTDGWVTKTAPPLFRPDFELQDGNRRLMADVPLDFVPYAEQVQRLMKSALEEARRFRRHTLVLPPKFWAYATPGEVFEWTSERNGYVSKLMRIDGVADRANLDVMIDITEVDPSDYDWNTETDFQPPVDGAVGVIRPQPQAIIDWFAEPWFLVDGSGDARRPAIRLAWDNGDGRLDDVIGIEYEVRLTSTLEKVNEGRTDQPQAGSLVTSQGLLPNEDYGIRGRYIPRGDRDTLWSGFLAVRTPDIKLGSKDIDVVADLTTIGRDVKAVFTDLGKELDDLRLRFEEATTAFTLDGAVGQIDRQKMRAELGAARAQIVEEKRVRVSEREALAETLTALSASFGENFAEGLVSFKAVASPENVLARFAIMLRAGTEDEFEESGFYIQIRTVGGVQVSEVGFLADKFTILTDDGALPVFAVDDGIVKIINASIAQAQIENLLVGSSNIAPGAVSVVQSVENVLPAQITLSHGIAESGQTFKARLDYNYLLQPSGSGSVSGAMILEDITTGSPISLKVSNVSAAGANPGPYRESSGPQFTVYSIPNDGRTETIIRLRTTVASGVLSNIGLIGLIFKR